MIFLPDMTPWYSIVPGQILCTAFLLFYISIAHFLSESSHFVTLQIYSILISIFSKLIINLNVYTTLEKKFILQLEYCLTVKIKYQIKYFRKKLADGRRKAD